MTDEMAPEFLELTVDSRTLRVPAGRTVSAAMVSEGEGPRLRRTRFRGADRGMFCGIGICFDCLVMIDGSGPLRSCLVEVEDGMEVTTMGQVRSEGASER